jgi:prepilin-type N-terminal cleavage/methylation domain-containing protein
MPIRRAGLSLIETLIAVAILGVLLGLVLGAI